MPNWKSKKDGTHYQDNRVKRDSSNLDVDVEVDVNDLESFADEKKSDFKPIWPKEGFHENFLKEKALESEFSRRMKYWIKKELSSDQGGDGESIIFQSKIHPEYTVELHPMDDDVDDDEFNKTEDGYTHYNAWYVFPAKNGKGIPNSPSVFSETGGYSKDDALKDLHQTLVDLDNEINGF